MAGGTSHGQWDDMLGRIQKEAMSDADYRDGIKLAGSDAVTDCSCYEKGTFAQACARVKSSGHTYVASVALDCQGRQIQDYSCTCPDARYYYGMCAHSVAVAFTYLPEVSTLARHQVTKPAEIYWQDTPPTKPATKSAKRKAQAKRVPPTSPQIQTLINSYAEQTAGESLALARPQTTELDEVQPPVELSCIIRTADAEWGTPSTSSDAWTLGMRISRGKASYVVKSVVELIDAWKSGATVSYGKRLSFAHTKDAFSERANRLLELVSGIVEAQRSLASAQGSRSYYSYALYEFERLIGGKTVALSTKQLLTVLATQVGGQVTVETSDVTAHGYWGTDKRVVTVVDEDPFILVELKRDNNVWKLDMRPKSFTVIGDERGLALVDSEELFLTTDAFAHDLGVFLSSVLPMGEALTIRDQDMPALCGAVLPALRDHTELDAPTDELEQLLPPTPDLTFSIYVEGDAVRCKATCSYQDQQVGLFDDVYEDQVVRDVGAEMVAQHVVASYFPLGDHSTPNYGDPYRGKAPADGKRRNTWGQLVTIPDPWFDKSDDNAYYLLFANGLAALSELGEVRLSEDLEHVSVRQAPRVNIEASVSGGLLDLTISADDMEPTELMAYLASYQRKQRFVRLEGGDIVRLDSSIATVDGLVAGLGLSERDLKDGHAALPANRTLFVDAMLKRQEGVTFSRNAAFRQIVRDFETVADADFTVPDEVTAKLRPYQTEGFRWLCTLGKVHFGGILADDMGLGKTLQAICYLEHVRQESPEDNRLPSLVVCPASLVYNWEAEIERFCPTLTCVCVTGPKRERVKQIKDSSSTDVLITSYDLMKRDVEAYEQTNFHAVVLDEAQYIKNPTTLAARSAKRLPGAVRFALTGTPIENRLQELWSIFDFLMPGVLGSKEAFTRNFATPIGGGDTECAERLRRLVSPFVLRRLKRDVLRDLPDKNESIVSSSLEGEQNKLYRAHAQRLRMQLEHQLPEEFAGMRLEILAELTKLRQICCDPSLTFDNYHGPSAKLETCMELVAQAIDGGHQLLLFSQFTSMLDIIAERLKATKTSYLMLTGATSKEARKKLVERFQEHEASVFLISLKAGGVGLNLTAADIVIHYDPWWNVAAEDQATDRTHRIGQTREVTVLKLIAKDTIEEKIVEMQEHKRALADAVIGGERVGSGAITREDILALLDV